VGQASDDHTGYGRVSIMQKFRSVGFLIASIFVLEATVVQAQAAGNSANGRILAQRWCASCHLVSEDQKTASSDVPTFSAIARRSKTEIDALAGFLADPHPPMPNLSLTRNEINDLLAYISSLKR
jgi:mono/diheme cytochrome c family protein